MEIHSALYHHQRLQRMIFYRTIQSADAAKIETGGAASSPKASCTTAYPNPAGTAASLTVTADPELAARLSVYNLLGEKVFSKDLSGNGTIPFDASKFPNGNYFVILRQGNNEAKTILSIQR